MTDAPRFTVELTAKDLEALELGLDLLHRAGTADEDEKTVTMAGDARQIISQAVLIADTNESLDAGRLSLHGDAANWADFCERARANPETRRRNTEILRGVVALHYPTTTTEKGHN